MSFSAVVLSIEYMVKNKLESRMYAMPEDLEKEIAMIILNKTGIGLSKRTEKQIKYDSDWHK